MTPMSGRNNAKTRDRRRALIGALVNAALESSESTQQEFADATGLSRDIIANMLYGRATAKPSYLVAIADVVSSANFKTVDEAVHHAMASSLGSAVEVREAIEVLKGAFEVPLHTERLLREIVADADEEVPSPDLDRDTAEELLMTLMRDRFPDADDEQILLALALRSRATAVAESVTAVCDNGSGLPADLADFVSEPAVEALELL